MNNDLKWTSGSLETLSKERLQILEKYLTGKTVLDVGCAGGAYAKHLKDKGYDVTAIDNNPDTIAKASKSFPDINFIVSNCEQTEFKDKSFDNIIVFDVLEHVDDNQALKEFQRICKNRVILSVPLEFDMTLGQHGLIYWHYQDNTHLRYYDEPGIRDICQKHNINIDDLILSNPVELKESIIDSMKTRSSLTKRLVRKFLHRLKLKTYYQTAIVIGSFSN